MSNHGSKPAEGRCLVERVGKKELGRDVGEGLAEPSVKVGEQRAVPQSVLLVYSRRCGWCWGGRPCWVKSARAHHTSAQKVMLVQLAVKTKSVSNTFGLTRKTFFVFSTVGNSISSCVPDYERYESGRSPVSGGSS